MLDGDGKIMLDLIHRFGFWLEPTARRVRPAAFHEDGDSCDSERKLRKAKFAMIRDCSLALATG